jgi:hypothetical protein
MCMIVATMQGVSRSGNACTACISTRWDRGNRTVVQPGRRDPSVFFLVGRQLHPAGGKICLPQEAVSVLCHCLPAEAKVPWPGGKALGADVGAFQKPCGGTSEPTCVGRRSWADWDWVDGTSNANLVCGETGCGELLSCQCLHLPLPVPLPVAVHHWHHLSHAHTATGTPAGHVSQWLWLHSTTPRCSA